jgi:3-hydroxypropionate dehydrogenase (NADP+)
VVLPKKIACVGAGTIGSSWALLYAVKGYGVIIYDVNDDAIVKSMNLIKKMLDTMVENDILKKSVVKTALGRIRATASLDGIAGYDYVQESAVERLDIKIELLGRLEKIVGKDVIIASSTSGLPITAMQKDMKHPERMVIAHPFNPPHLVPLVEIVRGPETSQSTVETVHALMESLDKVPVRINKQLPGFAANRLQTALFRESIAMLADGVVDADGLEKIMNAGIGLRWAFMGPIVTASLAGGAGGMEYYLEHFDPLIQSICTTLSTWTSIPEPVKKEVKRQTAELSLIKDKSYAELVRWRDENLIGILKERGYL